jgi:uncharacterized membrane protein YkoI
MRKPIIWIAGIGGAAALIATGTAVAFATGTATFSPSSATTIAEDSTDRQGDDRSTSPSASAVPSELEAAITAALAAAGPGIVIDADVDDNAAYAYEIDVQLDAGGVVEVKLDSDLNVVSTQPDDRSDDASGSDDAVPDEFASAMAADAALAHVGGGTVTSVELSDDADHVYEVEIDLGDGKDVDVELDADFAVVKAD